MRDKKTDTKKLRRKEYLVKKFHQKALTLYEDAKIATGYCARRYLAKVRKVGGLSAAKAWLKKKSKKDKPAKGFITLVDYGRLDLSLEALVIQDPWQVLFSDQELDLAKARLQKYGYFLKSPKKKKETWGDFDGISEKFPLNEGAKKTILVNAYERNPIARQTCIDYYKPICRVCGINFGKKYGPLAEGFIHIHHVCPLSCIDHEYEVDPVADLRPVCPNCHAVIHMKEPPLCIEEVKRLIKRFQVEDLFYFFSL